jgi:quercetin 2,3-dioxygenase
MRQLLLYFSFTAFLISLYYTDQVKLTLHTITDFVQFKATSNNHMSDKNTMAQIISHAKIVPRRSSERGHARHGWLDSYHTFSFASYYDPRFQNFGALRVLNEDRVAPGTGFPTHPHQNAEIFSYILSGELTHRDSMIRPGGTSNNKDDFYRMKRGDVQFTTGGKGIAHSEENEHKTDTVHFLQIWALPWKRGLPPIYHTSTFDETDKRKGFVNIISPLKAGPNATAVEEKEAVPTVPGTIPIHADLLFGAGIIPKGETFSWKIGGENAVASKTDRKTYIHVPMTKGGKAKIRLAGREESVLSEGDGAFVSNVNAGDSLSFESIGEEEAEVIVLDSN